MKKLAIIILAMVLVGFVAAPALATAINLAEYAINIDGTVSYITFGDPVPAGVNVGGFDDATGLGSITVTLSGAGPHFVGLFVDHEIDEATNTFFNEYGSANGTPAAGQSWEIDEPGYVFGDIYDNFYYSTLDSSNGVPDTAPDDVSMALGWNFTLAAGQIALIDFILSDSMIPPDFYLKQTDPDSNASIYFSSTNTVPEPSTLLLLGSGLFGLAALKRKLKG